MRRVAATAALGLLGLALLPGYTRAAAIQEVTVGTRVESWYHVTPADDGSVVPPAGGVDPQPPQGTPPVSPFPAGTLHVGLTGGQESARTYLQLSAAGISGEIVGGSLFLPLETDAGAGAVTPESAGIKACLAPDPGPDDVSGGAGSLPVVDCSTTAEAVHIPGDSPALTLDLASFGYLLGEAGIALLPADIDAAAQETWRAVIRGSDAADPGGGPRAILLVETGEAEAPSGSGFEADDFASSFGPSESPTFSAPELGRPDFTAPDPPAAAPVGPDEQVAQGAPFSAFGPPDTPFAYSAVLMFPIALVAALGWFGTNLTRPIPESRGAPS